jgi:hypothetical protein
MSFLSTSRKSIHKVMDEYFWKTSASSSSATEAQYVNSKRWSLEIKIIKNIFQVYNLHTYSVISQCFQT